MSRGCHLRMPWVPSCVRVPGNEEGVRLAVSALHFPKCSITLPMMSKPSSVISRCVISQHPCPGVATGTQPPLELTRSLCCVRVVLLHCLRAQCAFTNVNVSCIGQAGSPNWAHCSFSETLDDLLLQCLAYSVTRQCLFNTLSAIVVLRPDMKSVLF